MSSNPRYSDGAGRYDDGAVGTMRVLLDHKRPLIVYPIAIAFIVVAISFFFPNYYRSTVTVLPPERDFQSISQPTSDLKSFLSGGMALPVMATPSDILAAVLSSRSVRESTSTALNLQTRWAMTPKEVVEELETHSGVKVNPAGIIDFWVESQERWFSDTLANRMVAEADLINQAIVNTKASRTRKFVEGRLEETRRQLDSAALALERFQQEHKTVALDVEFKAMMEGAATLKAQLTADEIELSVLQGSLSNDHPRIRALESRIAQTKSKLTDLETPSVEGGRSFLGTGLTELPRLAQDLAVRLREVKVAEALYELLTQQYEHARIQERRDTPTFSVLDPASMGGKKVRPKRAYIGLGTLFASFILLAGFYLTRSYLNRLALVDPMRHASIVSLLHSVNPLRTRRSREMTP